MVHISIIYIYVAMKEKYVICSCKIITSLFIVTLKTWSTDNEKLIFRDLNQSG